MLARRIPEIVTALCVTGVFLLAGVYLFEAWPLMDDLGRAAAVREQSVLQCIAREYRAWTGRWSGVGSSYFLSASADLHRWYPWILLGLASVTWFAGYAALRFWLGDAASRLRCWGGSLCFFALYWLGMPAPAQSIYWMTGGLENLLNLSLAILIVLQLAQLDPGNQPSGRRLAVALGLGAASMFVAGMHELFTLLFAVVLVVGTGTAIATRRGDRRGWLIVTALHLTGAAIVFLAPGNADRLARHPEAGDFGLTLQLLGEQLVATIPWLVDPRLLALTALFALSPAVRAARPAWLANNRALLRWLIPATAAAVLVAGLAGPGWAMGREMPERTRNGLYFIFTVGWFATVFVWRAGGPLEPRAGGDRLRLAAALVFVACSGFPAALWPRDPSAAEPAEPGTALALLRSNATVGLEDLSRLPAFRAAQQQRLDYLTRAGSEEHQIAIVDPLIDPPRLLPTNEPGADPKLPQSLSLAQFFGVPIVRGPNPALGEYFVAPHVLSKIELVSTAADTGEGGRLFDYRGNQAFALVPPPLRIGGESEVRLWFRDHFVQDREPAGARAEARLLGEHGDTPAVVELELRTGDGEIVATATHMLAEPGRWIPLEIRAEPGSKLRAIHIAVHPPETGSYSRRPRLRFRNVRLLWP